MTRFTLWLAAAALTLVQLTAHAQEATPEDLKRQRAAADATYEASAAACQTRFAVNACEERAREVHRAEASRLRAIELAHADARRQHRAQAYAARVESRQSQARAAAARDAGSAPSSARVSLAALAEVSTTSSPAATGRVATGAIRKPDSRPAKTAGRDRTTAEQASREKFDARQEEATEHREHVERRNAERDGHKKAPPLPVPASAARAP